MKESTAVVSVILGVLLTIITIVAISINSNNVKVQAGLQECVVNTSLGGTRVVWQKECK